MKLWDLVGQWKELRDFAMDPDVDPQAIADTMEALDGEIEVKADNYAFIIKELKVKAAAIDGEIKELEKIVETEKAKKKALERNMESLKNNLLAAMIALNKTKFKTDHHSFWTQQTPPATIIDDEKAVTEEYLIPQDPKIDKEKIKDAIQKGEWLSFAHLESHDSLRFR